LDQYIHDILEPVLEQMTDEERKYGYFQPDGGTAHTAKNSITGL
jgi:hypothetical protein